LDSYSEADNIECSKIAEETAASCDNTVSSSNNENQLLWLPSSKETPNPEEVVLVKKADLYN
jgi:hypothetical protein